MEASDHGHSNIHSEILHLLIVVLGGRQRETTLVQSFTFIGLSASVSREGMRVPQSLVRRIKDE
jgi:hypothetical protein